MLHQCTLVIAVTNVKPRLSIVLNNYSIDYLSDWQSDQHGNILIHFTADLTPKNIISITVENLENSNSITLKDIIIDDIRFGLVTFLCTTINNKQDTQLNTTGSIDIEICTPIWEWWSNKTNSFNYKEYPLGSLS